MKLPSQQLQGGGAAAVVPGSAGLLCGGEGEGGEHIKGGKRETGQGYRSKGTAREGGVVKLARVEEGEV
jgi:hypothetical protein